MKTQRSMLLALASATVLSGCGSSGDSSDSLRLMQIATVFAAGSAETTDFAFSADGTLATQTLSQDGQTITTTYSPDDDGRYLHSSEGIDELISQYEYLDDLGLSRIYRSNSDGMIDTVEIFRFEDSLVLSSDLRDIDDVGSISQADSGSGVLQARRTFSYTDGRLTAIRSDIDGNGSIDTLEDFSYNADGTVQSSTLSSLSGGAISSSNYIYERGGCHSASGNSTNAFYCVSSN